MASAYDKASLVMLPHAYKDDKLYSVKPEDRSGDFTFSRDGAGASPATRVNASGLIEKGRTNEISWSNDFSKASWVKTDSSVTSGQSGYDGTNNAWLLSKSAANGRLIQNLSAGAVLTFSVYAKAGTLNYMRLRVSGTSNASCFFDFTDGSIHNNDGFDASMEDIGGGWYRCSYTFNSTITGLQIYPADSTSSVAGTSGNILIQDAQIETSLVATEIIDTEAPTSAGLLGDMPRLDYSGGATCPSLLLEPSRVNVFTQSEFVGWTIENASGDYNNATSPEGVQNAILLTANGGSQDHTAYIETSSLSPATYSYSVFVKKGTQRYVHLTLNERYVDSSWITATFDLDTLTKADHSSGTGYVDGTSDITDYGNGWYRLEMTGALVNTTTYLAFVGWANGLGAPNTSRGRYNVTTSGTFYAYGAQLESGSYPTSYIPTYGSASGRADDECEKTGVSDLIGQTEGTMFVEAKVTFDSRNGRIMLLQGVSNHFMELVGLATRKVQAFVYNGSTQANIQTTTLYSSGDTLKIAFAYKANDFVLYINGVQQGTDTSGSLPSSMSKIILNNYTAAGYSEANAYKQALLFKTRLTNAELAALTA